MSDLPISNARMGNAGREFHGDLRSRDERPLGTPQGQRMRFAR